MIDCAYIGGLTGGRQAPRAGTADGVRLPSLVAGTAVRPRRGRRARGPGAPAHLVFDVP